MELTLFSLLIPFVLLLAVRAGDYDVDSRDMELCKLIDRSAYARLVVYEGRICYFLVKKYTAQLSEEMDGFRFDEARKMCKKHKEAHLPIIRTKEEAKFIMRHFSISSEFYMENGPVDRIMLGVVPHYEKGEYLWDDLTDLTYKPEEWNGYHSGRARHSRYVVMHLQNPIDGWTVRWTSTGLNVTEVSEPVGLVCQLQIEGKATTVVDAALRETIAATTGDSGGTAACSVQVIVLALATVALLHGST